MPNVYTVSVTTISKSAHSRSTSPGQWECMEGMTEVAVTQVHVEWVPWEPNNAHPSGSTENCAVLSVWRDPSGKWNDIPCHLEGYTVCKQPL